LLVVDDLEDWRYALKMLFDKRPDVIVEEAVSGDDAVEKVKAKDYDLVLLDMRMPSETEGLDALSEIKRVKPRTQVIVMSAFGDFGKVVDAVKRGALDFLPKDENFDGIVRFKVDEFIRKMHLVADRERLIHTKYAETSRFKHPHQKGKSLEDLLAALMASVEGFFEIGRNINTETEEIDLVFRNGSQDPSWRRESDIIILECKNWDSQRVGKNELISFERKIENRRERCRLGFLVCTASFAETVSKELLRSSRTGTLVVPIDGGDLRHLVNSKDRGQLLRSFVDRALLL
jgi:DNA-binding NarL/FixJ family response regulator